VGNAVLQQPHLQPTFNIASGKHNIRVVVPGFEPFVTDLEVLGNGSTQWIIHEPPSETPTETTGQANESNASLDEPKMTKYQNLGGDSNIEEYESGEDYIKVRFRRSSVVYVYDATAPGAEMVAEMKRLAAEGRGLSSYISQQVKSNFSRKE
jgi:hypothetical protein